MAETSAGASSDGESAGFKYSQHGRFYLHLREALVAYLLILPATLATFLFGIYPVVSGLWESFKAGSPTPTSYVGLDQYIRAVGSLIYVVIFMLVVLFCYLALQAWQRARQEQAAFPGDRIWWYLVPGFVLALGTFVVLALLVTGGYRYRLFAVGSVGVSVLWAGVLLLVLGLGGYYGLSRTTQGNKGVYVLNTWLVMLLTVLPVLMMRYTYGQLQGDVERSRRIATLILNTNVASAEPLRPVSGARFVGIEIGEVPVNVQIGDAVYTAVLNPASYEKIPTDRLQMSSTLSFANQQNVEVIIPLERGFGLEPVDFVTQAQLVVERGPRQIGLSGPPTLEIPVTIDPSRIEAPYDILFPGDIGPDVIREGGYTAPIERPFMATLAVAFCLGVILIIGTIRRQMDEEQHRTKMIWLSIGRVTLWLIIGLLVIYIISQVEFYRNASVGIQKLSQQQFTAAYEYATGEIAPRGLFRDDVARDLMFFPQIISISAGALLIGAAYIIWVNAKNRDTGMGMVASILFATFLMVGGWLCIGELPGTLALAGQDAIKARDAMIRTALFSMGTVPTQLAFGMLLAYLMFYEVTAGKGIFRLIYFMPYITPQVATAAVFTVIFSIRPNSLANQFLNLFGINDQKWLQEGNGIFRVLYAEIFNGNPAHVPDLFQGPSLALTTVILFNIWVYAGYNSVIFLAGLGSIPGELYEAARVDGAGRWAAFRHITFPLLSPVTFFLSVLSIIGTFKAFSSVYVLRADGNNYADTFTVRIFEALKGEGNRGYAAALAFVLFGVILILTMIQNRLAKERVFYG